MTIVFEIDYEALAFRLHLSEPEVRHLLKHDESFFLKHLKCNPQHFIFKTRVDSDKLMHGENLEIFLTDWRHKNDQSFSQLTTILNTMDQEVKNLQDKVTALEAKTDVALGALSNIKDQNAALQQQIANNSQLSDEDKASLKATSDSIDAEIAKVDAAVPPATDTGNAPATTEAPAEQPAS